LPLAEAAKFGAEIASKIGPLVVKAGVASRYFWVAGTGLRRAAMSRFLPFLHPWHFRPLSGGGDIEIWLCQVKSVLFKLEQLFIFERLYPAL
jgi:hypothetical protein